MKSRFGKEKVTQAAVWIPAALLLTALPATAAAQWSTIGQIQTYDPVTGAAVDAEEVVAVANSVDLSDPMAPFRAQIFHSTDGGERFARIHGALGDEAASNPLMAVAFRGSTILVSRGEEVLRLTSPDGAWQAHSAGADLLALTFVDDQRVVGVGSAGAVRVSADGGETWSIVDSGTSVDLRGLFFSGSKGWAWGYDTRPEGDQEVITSGVLIATENAGESWETLQTYSGKHVGAAWFDRHGLGFIGISTPEEPGSKDALLSVLRTEDGGRTFTDMNIPTRVGTANAPFVGAQDLDASYLALARAEGPTIRLVTLAFVMEGQTGSSGGGGGSTQSVMDLRRAEIVSVDHGATWIADDLGVIEINMTGVGPGDGYVVGGALHDLHSGIMVVQDGRVWGLTTDCASEGDCFEGYECPEGECLPIPAPEEPEDDPDDPEDQPEEGSDGEEDGGDGGDQSLEAGGCECSGTGGGSSGIGLLFLLLGAAGSRSRKRSGALAARP
ncbi:MAG: WD40/YVTN/BNR-like repeat-containing protein [Myxococcota bacterium]